MRCIWAHLAMSWPHVNAIRDRFFADQTLKSFAYACASWVDHETDILTASWTRLAEPILRNAHGQPPRKTAVRYMAELERMGVFKLINRGKFGRGSRSEWQFMLPRTAENRKCAPK